MRNMLIAVAAIACFAVGAQAQLALNEIYVSHDGSDDMEFIEVIGTAGTSLNDVFVVEIEGEVSSTEGRVNSVYDLSGNVIPADGYFVLGSPNEPNVDLALSASNNWQNGTATYYLIQAQDPVGLLATDNTVVTDPMNPTATILNTFGSILDSVGLMENNTVDIIYDGATVLGPNGNNLPAGVFRDGDFPNAWNNQFFLDFFDTVNTNQPRTPGAANTSVAAVSPAFPGNTGDVAFSVERNGSVDVQLDGIHSIAAADDFGFEISSPMGTLDNRPFALVATLYPTGMNPIAAPLVPSMGGTINLDAWVQIPGSTFALIDGTANPNAFSPRVSPFGFDYGPFQSDVSFAGTSALLQVIVDAPGFGMFQFATSDARELNFTM